MGHRYAMGPDRTGGPSVIGLTAFFMLAAFFAIIFLALLIIHEPDEMLTCRECGHQSMPDEQTLCAHVDEDGNTYFVNMLVK
jgi:hypothetical protein